MRRVAPSYARLALRPATAVPATEVTPLAFVDAHAAGACSRRIGLDGARVSASRPDHGELWARHIDNTIRNRWKETTGTFLAEKGWTVETDAPLSAPGRLLQGTVDVYAANDETGSSAAVTFVVAHGTGFRDMVGINSASVATGPRADYVARAAVAGYLTGADETRISVVSLEGISPATIDRHTIEAEFPERFPAAEWAVPTVELTGLAEAELDRIRTIRADV